MATSRAGVIGRAGPRAATAYIAISGDFSQLHKGIAGQSALLAKKGNKLGKALTVGLTAGAAGAAAAGTALFKIGEQFDAASDKIRTNTGATGKNLRRLEKDFKAVIKSVPTDFDSASTAVAGLNQRLGLTGRPLRRLSRQMTELSRITGTDVNENVEATTRLFGDWSIKTGKQSATLDKLFRASQATGIGVSDLSRLMVQFGSPLRQLGLSFDFSAAMFARFEKEGVNIQTLLPGLRFALKTFSKEGREPAKALRETFREIENAAGAAKANQLAFETFGVRAGPDMAAAIREGRFDLDQLMRTMRNGKDTIRSAGRDTEDFSEKWLKFKNNVLVGLEPVATRVFQGVGREADKLFSVLSDPKLTTDEKISKIFDRIGEAASSAIPVIAERMAQAAPRAAEAFARAWVAAPIWGRLLIGGWLLSKLGGLAAFRKLGTLTGAALGGGIATGAATAAAGGAAAGGAAGGGLLASMRAKVLPVAKRLGLAGVGIALADSVVSEFGRRAQERSPDLFKAIEAKKGGPFAGDVLSLGGLFRKDSEKAARSLLPVLQDIAEKAKAISPARAKELRLELGRLGGTSDEARGAFNRLIDGAVAKGRGIREIKNEFGRMRSGAVLSVKELRTVTQSNFKAIAQTMGVNSKAGKDALQTNFRLGLRTIRDFRERGVLTTKSASVEIARLLKVHSGAGKESLKRNYKEARDFIAKTMRNSKGITQEGMSAIRQIFAKELKLYGLSDKEIGFRLRGKEFSGKSSPGGTTHTNAQRGAYIDTGKPSGDSVPAMLERGEYVLNRKAVRTLGKDTLDQINFGAAPRFQTGGWVQGAQPPSGPNSGPIRAFAERMFKLGFSATSGGEYRGSGTYHDQQMAIDWGDSANDLDRFWQTVRGQKDKFAELLGPSRFGGLYNYGKPFSDPGLQADHEDHWHTALLNMLRGALGKAGSALAADPKIKRLLVDGPDSPIKSVMQGAIDTVRNAAQRNLTKLAQEQTGLLSGFSGGGSNKANIALGRKMAARYGWTGPEFAALVELWNHESGWSHTADNPTSSAYGIPQAMTHIHDLPGDYMTNPATQIAWGLNYIKGRYGSPSKALAFWNSQNPHWYQKGGLVGMVGDSLGVGTVGAGLNNMIGGRLRANNAIGRSSAGGVDALKGYLGKKFTQFIFDLGTNDGSPGATAASLRRADQMTGKRPLLAMLLKGPNKGALGGVGSGDVHTVDWPGELGPDGLHPTNYGPRASALAAAVKRFAPKEKKRTRKGAKQGPGKRPQTGGAAPSLKHLANTLSVLRNSDDKAKRSNALHGLLDKIKAVGLPAKIGDNIEGFQTGADIAGEMASRAGTLTFEPVDEKGDPLLDAENRPITQWGVVGGKNEIQWLTEQLSALFKLRNAIIRAENLIVERREQMSKLVELAQERLKDIAEQIRFAGNVRRQVQADLEKAEKKPKKNKRLIGQLKNTLKLIDSDQKGRVRVRDNLDKRIKPALTGKRSALNTSRGHLLESLTEVQGLGSSMELLQTLPARGVLGGTIFEVQNQLAELSLPKQPVITDIGSPDTETGAESESAALLRQLLDEANRRTLVSEKQFEVFKNFPPFGGQFHTGGIVPGRPTEERLAVLRGQEGVFTEDQMAAMGGGRPIHVTVVAEDGAVDVRKIRVIAQEEAADVTRRQARAGARGLPGGGGGGLR